MTKMLSNFLLAYFTNKKFIAKFYNFSNICAVSFQNIAKYAIIFKLLRNVQSSRADRGEFEQKMFKPFSNFF